MATWAFLLKGLCKLAAMAKITDIVPVAHGAAGVLVDATASLALPMLDYEHPIQDDGYDAGRGALLRDLHAADGERPGLRPPALLAEAEFPGRLRAIRMIFGHPAVPGASA